VLRKVTSTPLNEFRSQLLQGIRRRSRTTHLDHEDCDHSKVQDRSETKQCRPKSLPCHQDERQSERIWVAAGSVPTAVQVMVHWQLTRTRVPGFGVLDLDVNLQVADSRQLLASMSTTLAHRNVFIKSFPFKPRTTNSPR
jgi:hypothetical protein